MKKRVLSIVCVIALIATMISAGAIYAFGTDKTPLVGTAFEHVSNFKAEEWTFSHTAGNVTSGGLRLEDGATDKAENVSATYNETLDLTNGFTLTYTMWSNEAKNNWEVGRAYKGAVVGNISAHFELATSTSIKMVIKVNNEVVATSDPVALPDGAVAYTYLKGSSDQTLDYDPATKTITFSMCVVSTQDTYTVSYVDTADAVDVSDASVAIKSNTTWALYAHCSKAKLVGKEPPAPPASLVGTGFEFDGNAVAEDWTFTHADSGINSNGEIKLTDVGPDKAETPKATYKDTFVLTDGFTLTYSAKSTSSTNYAKGYLYHAADVGNISARVTVADDAKTAVQLVIKLGDDVVATGEPVAAATLSAGTYFYDYHDYILNYDAATKTITYSMVVGGEPYTVTYVDSENQVDLADAVVLFRSNSTWDIQTWYSKAKLVGKTVPVVPGPGEGGEGNEGGEGGEGNEGGEDTKPKGEALTEAWAPETFVEADWLDSEGKFDANGNFTMGGSQGTKTIWTVKNYDLSAGFTFKGILNMKNSYNNYYGEWCSAYFGTEEANLELRIRNDERNAGSGKGEDNTYTAYIILNGEELATSDLLVLPNGQYELTYKDGKVAVSLGGVALKWTTSAGEVTAVDVAGADLSNAKLGLKLSGNWHPSDRRWREISLAPLSAGSGNGNGGAVATGDARNIVLPAVVMLVCAVSAAFILKRKARA